MSCMVMKKEPLAALANAVEARLNCDYGFWGFEAPTSLYDAFRDCRGCYSFSAEAIYKKLYAFNIKAYNGRYAGHEEPGDDIAPEVDLTRYKIHHGPEYREHGFAVRPWHFHLAKLLDFYIYQTNEDATYRDQLWEAMHEFSSHLKSFIVQNSPDYTAGRWGELPPAAQTVKAGYNRSKEIEPLILEPEDWQPGEWATLCKLAGHLPPQDTERIVISGYTLETYITQKEAKSNG